MSSAQTLISGSAARDVRVNPINPPMIDDPMNLGTLIPNPNYNPSHDVPTGWSFLDTLKSNRSLSRTHP